MLGGLKLEKWGTVKIKNVNNIMWIQLEILLTNKSEITCKVSQSEDITVKKQIKHWKNMIIIYQFLHHSIF